MFDNGFDPGYVFRHPVFLVTFIIAVPAWIIAFAGQCAAEAKYASADGRTPVVNTLWFGIWIQLAVIVHLFLALAGDALAIHRFQLAVVLAISTVFAVHGVEFIFQPQGALIAVGVGWLLLTMVDLVWIIYLTSEEDSFFYNLLNSGGTGGLSGPSNRRMGSTRISHRDSTGGYGGGGAGEMGLGSGGMSRGISSNNMNMGIGGGGGLGGSGYPSGGYAPAATEGTPQKATSVRNDYDQQSPGGGVGGGDEAMYKHKAKAMYAYSASPDDPNEVSFAKGDILDVLDNTGKWFQVRTPTGATGIAPSNYLTVL
ncbi:SHO1 osmosensor [Kwoniella heveanensis CBS 569]|uniref:SHO1 osmosensor n=1 Tax=Kwoniella heveanensis BCC8398 TaxID=1296120 RepID=A0A1B9GTZ3_9TREE|nr:SHO1 osmosensor [Kwoniella heveanensis BCC8398]OCF42515.1 SHO1 osmosensor [Kwoniella heveanensis CBS 569]